MKKYLFIYLILTGFFTACRPKEAEPVQVGKIWKAKTVKENGTLVYTAGSTANARPGYSKFRLDLSATDQVTFTDLDGRKLTGNWSLSTDNNRLILQNLTPPPSESSGNIEFYINTPPSDSKLDLKRTNESRKTGNSVNEYELVPE